MDQIAQAMSETGQATTQFVTGAQETQTAIGGLSELARQLEGIAGHFRLANGSAAAGHEPPSGQPAPEGEREREPVA